MCCFYGVISKTLIKNCRCSMDEHAASKGDSMKKNDKVIQEIILFDIADVLCGLDICNVLEIKKVTGITTVYGAPEVVEGVINLRGQIVTVLNIRKWFSDENYELTGRERIMIVPNKDEQVGLLVDNVNDVIQFDNNAVQAIPANMDENIARFFNAVYQWSGNIVSLVSLEQILSADTDITTLLRGA